MRCTKESKCLYRYPDNDAGFWCGKWKECNDMNMGENEILRDYHEAKDKFRQVKILAEQNLIKPKEMAQWLVDHGETVDKRYFSTGKVPAKVKGIDPAEKHELREAVKDAAKAMGITEPPAKDDANKPRLSLVPTQIMFDIAEVREYGCKKYHDPNNWKRVEAERYREAAFRHFLRYIDNPDGVDEESGILHRKHVECNLAFLAAMEEAK